MTIGGNSRTRTMLLAACAALAIAPASAYAQQGEQRVSYSIPAQDLGTALTELARQSNREIVFSAELTRGKRAPRLSGKMTFEQALGRLLSGSGLSHRLNASGSVVIETAEERVGNDERAGDASRGVAEILVVGNRSQNTDIRRSRDDAQPYVVFSGEDIARSGASSVGDYLFTRLPQNQQSSQSNASNPGLTGINLRGLGLDETLILIDGRRAPAFSQGSGGGFQQSRIDGIPPAMIERIEILPATAGGIYGGNATGGVVNIILKRNYSGLDLSATYGNTFDFVQGIQDYSLSGGVSLNQGRTRVSFSAAYRDEGALEAADRSRAYQKGRELQFANNPNALTTPLAYGATPNICATATTTSTTCASNNLVLDNGTALGSNKTYVPVGYSGPYGTGANDGGAALGTNSGRYNTAVARGFTVTNALKRYSGALGVRQDFSTTVEGFIDLAFDRSEIHSRSTSSVNVNIPGSSIYNPFQQNILVNTRSALSPLDYTIENIGGKTGVILKLPSQWSASAEYGYAESKYEDSIYQSVQPNAAQIDYLRSVILRDPATGAFDMSIVNFNRQNVTNKREAVTQSGVLRLGGPVLKLPAGSVSLNASALIERTNTRDGTIVTATIPGTASYSFLPGSSRREMSGYMELRAPLFSERNGVPLLRRLEMTGAVRIGSFDYRTSGSLGTTSNSPTGPFPSLPVVERNLQSTNFTFTGLYSPFGGVTFRSSYGTGFLPPNLNQLVGRSTTSVPAGPGVGLPDPARGGTPIDYAYSLLDSGNPKIAPEKSKSFAIGIIFEPAFAKGLRVSLDYISLQKRDEIYSPSLTDIVLNPTVYPGRVTRAPLTQADAALGYIGGTILTIDRRFTNISSTRLEAFDLQADYNLSTSSFGDWHFYVIGSYQPTLVQQPNPTVPSVSSVGFASGPLKWRGNFGIDWHKGPISAGWNAQFYDAYRVCPVSIATNPFCSGTVELAQGSRKIPSQIYQDINVTYRFEKGFLHDTELALVVQNVFDKAPRPLASTLAAIAAYGDPRMRRFLLTVRKSIK